VGWNPAVTPVRPLACLCATPEMRIRGCAWSWECYWAIPTHKEVHNHGPRRICKASMTSKSRLSGKEVPMEKMAARRLHGCYVRAGTGRALAASEALVRPLEFPTFRLRFAFWWGFGVWCLASGVWCLGVLTFLDRFSEYVWLSRAEPLACDFALMSREVGRWSLTVGLANERQGRCWYYVLIMYLYRTYRYNSTTVLYV